MRVFLDANILFSAGTPHSPTNTVLHAVLAHSTALVNAHVCEEAQRNLAVKRPALLGEYQRVCGLLELTSAFYTGPLPDVPDQDKPVLAGAIGARCSPLWTSDRRHFGVWYGTSIHGVRVVNSGQMADVLIECGWQP